jgi:ribonuclease P protein component
MGLLMCNNFPQELRLKTGTQFKDLFTRAQQISSKKFKIFYLANSLSHPRLGIVVTKKNLHHAYLRNSFKRIARESFRLKQHQLKNCDYLVYAFRAEYLPKKELRLCLDQYWEKLITLQY